MENALNVGVSDNRWGNRWWINVRGLGWWDQAICGVQTWYLTKKHGVINWGQIQCAIIPVYSVRVWPYVDWLQCKPMVEAGLLLLLSCYIRGTGHGPDTSGTSWHHLCSFLNTISPFLNSSAPNIIYTLTSFLAENKSVYSMSEDRISRWDNNILHAAIIKARLLEGH